MGWRVMKFPKMVRKPKIPIHVTVESEERNEFGEVKTVVDADFLCNYQGKASIKIVSDRSTVTVTGTALIDGDIAPDIAEITGGSVIIFGEEREIFIGYKARNPDGTVNFTRLDLK